MVKKTNSARPPSPPSAKRFLVIGDEVYSATDGQVHYVSARRLVDLYGLDPRECVLVDRDQRMGELLNLPQGLRVLRPRNDGNYRHPNGG